MFFTLGWICFVDPPIIYKADLTWYFALLLFLPVTALYTRRWIFSSSTEYVYALGFLLAIMLAGIFSDHTVKALIYSAKLAFSLLFLWPLIRSNLAHLKWLIRGITSLVVVNFMLLALHFVAGAPTAQFQADGRWSTALSSIGVIGVPGAFVFSYYLLQSIVIGLKLRDVLLAAAGVALSLASGSRGVIFLCLMALAAAGLAVFLGRPLSRLYRLSLLAALTLLALVLVARRQITSAPVMSDRVANFFDASAGMDDDRLNAEDPLRYRMLQLAMEAIRDHPFKGAGLLTLGIPAEGGTLQVIHNRYLSSWAELGLLGFVSLLGIVLSWVPDGWAMLRRRKKAPISANDRFHLIWTSLMLAQFAVFGLFFPIGVQISDWVIFLLAKAIFRRSAAIWRESRAAGRRPPLVSREAAVRGRFAAARVAGLMS
jgi:O-antigen ligase